MLFLAACSGADESGQDGAAPPRSDGTPAVTTPACDAPCYSGVEHLGALSPDVVAEPSGMTASRRNPDVYYVVGDEPGTSEFAAVRDDGTLVARVEVEGMSARNAEALAVGSCGPRDAQTCLFVGDIGNHVELEDLFIYRIAEPDLSEPSPDPVPADVLRYTYPGTPTDAEALLVDHAGRPLIISKAPFESGVNGPTRLYRGDVDGGRLEDLGEIAIPEPDGGAFAGIAGNGVTDASTADGRVLLRTYDHVLEYRATDPGADLAGFPGWPVRVVPAPDQIQSETVTYRAGGCGYLTTSELTGSIDAVGCLG